MGDCQGSYDVEIDHDAMTRHAPHPDFPDLPLEGYLGCPLFPRINIEFPGLQLINERPYIFLVNDFLDEAECEALMAKASKGLVKQSAELRQGGKRTSSGVICENKEVPAFRKRISELTLQDESQLQHLKISKYVEGEEFTLHTDALSAPKDRCSTADIFGDAMQQKDGNAHCTPGHNRFLTVFVYLNDCKEGGCTTFPRIGIHYGEGGESFYDRPGPFNCSIERDGSTFNMANAIKQHCSTIRVAPRRGLAVIHFPSLTPEHGGTVDGNVTHCSEPAVDTKFICQQFIYSCKDSGRDTKSLPSGRLSDVIL